MLLHINTPAEIAQSFRDQSPVTALCGYRRVIDEDRHNSRVSDPQNTICPGCQSIMDYEVRQGRARPMSGMSTVSEIKALAAQPQQNTWTFTFKSGPTTWDKRFPLAG